MTPSIVEPSTVRVPSTTAVRTTAVLSMPPVKCSVMRKPAKPSSSSTTTHSPSAELGVAAIDLSLDDRGLGRGVVADEEPPHAEPERGDDDQHDTDHNSLHAG